MRIESIKVKNYKVFQDVEVKEIPNMAVFLGMNGVGKTTFFDVFEFLHDALQSNIRAALAQRGIARLAPLIVDKPSVCQRGLPGHLSSH